MADFTAKWNREAFSRKMKARRTELGLNQEQVSESAGMSVTALSFLETGKTVPNVHTIDLLSGALQTPPNEILEWGYTVIA